MGTGCGTCRTRFYRDKYQTSAPAPHPHPQAQQSCSASRASIGETGLLRSLTGCPRPLCPEAQRSSRQVTPAYVPISFCTSAAHPSPLPCDSHGHSTKGPSLLSQERGGKARTLPEELLDQIIPDLSQSQVSFQVHSNRSSQTEVKPTQAKSTGLIALYFSRSEMQIPRVIYL